MSEPLTPVPGDLGPVARALAARDPNAEPNVVTLAEVEAVLQPRIVRDRLLDRSDSLAWVMRAQHVTSMVIDPAQVSGPPNAKASLINEQRWLIRDLLEANKGLPYMPLSAPQAETWKVRLAALADRVERFSPTHAALLRSDDMPPRRRVLQAAAQVSAMLDQTRGEAVQDADTLIRYNDIAARLAAAPANQTLRHIAIAQLDDGKLTGAQMRFLNDLLTANERVGIPADIVPSITNKFIAGQFADAVDELTPQTVLAMSVAQRVDMASALQAKVGGDATYAARDREGDRGLAALVNYSTPGDAAILLAHIHGKVVDTPLDAAIASKALALPPSIVRDKLSADSLYAARSIEAGLHATDPDTARAALELARWYAATSHNYEYIFTRDVPMYAIMDERDRERASAGSSRVHE